MKFWQSVSWMETEQLCEFSVFAEELGFAGVISSDHALYPAALSGGYPYSQDGMPPQDVNSEYPDTWASFGAIARATKNLRLLSGVFVLPLRNPVDIAKQSATLSLLSDGRFCFGVGAGWMREEFAIYGVDFETRIERMEEMVQVLQGLWQEKLFAHHGRFFDFPAIKVTPTPRKKIPLFFGGSSEAALRRATALGDGWIGAGNTPEELRTLLAQIKTLLREQNRATEDFETVCALYGTPDLALYRELAECGMDGVVNFPLALELGPHSSLHEKKRLLEQYAETVIQRY